MHMAAPTPLRAPRLQELVSRAWTLQQMSRLWRFVWLTRRVSDAMTQLAAQTAAAAALVPWPLACSRSARLALMLVRPSWIARSSWMQVAHAPSSRQRWETCTVLQFLESGTLMETCHSAQYSTRRAYHCHPSMHSPLRQVASLLMDHMMGTSRRQRMSKRVGPGT